MTDQPPDNRLSSGRNAAGRFVRGASGNPGGRPRREREIKHILDAATGAVLRAAVEHALRGDAAAMRLVLDRGAPIAKTIPVQNAEIAPQSLIAALIFIINGLPGGAAREGLVAALSGTIDDQPPPTKHQPPHDIAARHCVSCPRGFSWAAKVTGNRGE